MAAESMAHALEPTLHNVPYAASGSAHTACKRIAQSVCIALVLACSAGSSLAQPAGYPSRPLRLITPSSPGSGVDIVARVFAQKLSEQVGQPAIVDNRAGAGANLGAEIAAKAPPDGYNLFVATPAHVINSSLYSRLNYDLMRDFSPVSLLTTGEYIVVVHPSVPARSIRELIALARAKPGALSYGSGGNGNATHLAGELFGSMSQTTMLHVPYKGSGPALTDLMSGQVQVMFANLTAALGPLKSGRLRALATTGEKRSRSVPNVPTVSESGLPGYVVTSYYGLLVPAGTSPEIVARLNAEAVKAMSAPEMRERLAAEGAEPASSTPAQFGTFLRAEIGKWAKVVKAARIHAD
jgi:tripartite-type tricarboxylate transporter receptor subunit TctC